MTLLTKNAQKKADAARYAIAGFVEEISNATPEDSIVLDAGAGNCRYRPYFKDHRYIAADFCQVEDKNYTRMDVVTDLMRLALKDESIDVVLNIEVLEHVPEPMQMLRELNRVLKPGGLLYLTCPLNWGVHEAPYDFYRYTPFALKKMFTEAGFNPLEIKPKGGYYWLLAKYFTRLPAHLNKPEKGVFRKFLYKVKYRVLREIFFYWLPYILFHMDRFDKKKDFTLGYMCTAKKEVPGS
jgi:SAM-dependent methyltransferase